MTEQHVAVRLLHVICDHNHLHVLQIRQHFDRNAAQKHLHTFRENKFRLQVLPKCMMKTINATCEVMLRSIQKNEKNRLTNVNLRPNLLKNNV